MAREIVTHIWCDICQAESDQHERGTHSDTFTIGNGKPTSLDLCERHHKELVGPLVDALAEHGAIVRQLPATDPEKPKRGSAHSNRPGPFYCKVEGCASGPLKSLGSFNAHRRQMHGLSPQEYRERYGEPIAGDAGQVGEAGTLFGGASTPIGASEAACDLCDKVYSHALGNKRPTQALGVHKQKVHGVEGARVVKSVGGRKR